MNDKTPGVSERALERAKAIRAGVVAEIVGDLRLTADAYAAAGESGIAGVLLSRADGIEQRFGVARDASEATQRPHAPIHTTTDCPGCGESWVVHDDDAVKACFEVVADERDRLIAERVPGVPRAAGEATP